MPDKTKKQVGNVWGAFYVDIGCVDCDLCRNASPSNFSRNPSGGYSFVHKQPENEKELQDCLTALTDCPVGAIGNDGEEASAP